MTSFDYVVLGIIGMSIFFSIMRGLVREVLALVGWVAAFFVAKTYTLELAPLLPKSLSLKVAMFSAPLEAMVFNGLRYVPKAIADRVKFD